MPPIAQDILSSPQYAKKLSRTEFARTYVKLQQAYFSESSTVGGWTLIGYSAPNDGGTTNFYYGIGDIGLENSAALSGTPVAWQAANKNQLNECAQVTGVTGGKVKLANANWTVTLSAKSGQVSDVSFEAKALTAGCQSLTPTFNNIGK